MESLQDSAGCLALSHLLITSCPCLPSRKLFSRTSFFKLKAVKNSWIAWFAVPCKLDEHKIARISQLAVGQRDNPVSHLASNFGSVLKAKRVTLSLVKRLLGEYDLSRVKAVQWGVNNEKEAIRAFTLKKGKSVKDTGIWFDSAGILGASPDDTVDDETVLEAVSIY